MQLLQVSSIWVQALELLQALVLPLVQLEWISSTWVEVSQVQLVWVLP